MTKSQYMQMHNITIRPVNSMDTAQAETDYQRNSRYIIQYNGHEYYSLYGYMDDMRDVVRFNGDDK